MVAQLFITYEWSDWFAFRSPLVFQAAVVHNTKNALTLLDRRNAQVWWVQSVYVAPAHRRMGHYRCTQGQP